MIEQAALFQGSFLDLPPFAENGMTATEVDVSRCEVAEAFMVSAMVVMFDEGVDGLLESAG